MNEKLYSETQIKNAAIWIAMYSGGRREMYDEVYESLIRLLNEWRGAKMPRAKLNAFIDEINLATLIMGTRYKVGVVPYI